MGHTYFAASVGHRYSDACQTFVALESSKVDIVGASGIAALLEELAEDAAEYERGEIHDSHDDESCNGTDCCDDVVTYGAFAQDVRDLFTAAELREHRRALLNGEVVAIYR